MKKCYFIARKDVQIFQSVILFDTFIIEITIWSKSYHDCITNALMGSYLRLFA